MELITIIDNLNKQAIKELRKANPLIDFYDRQGKRSMPVTFRPKQASVISEAIKARAKREKLSNTPPLSECTFRGHAIKIGAE